MNVEVAATCGLSSNMGAMLSYVPNKVTEMNLKTSFLGSLEAFRESLLTILYNFCRDNIKRTFSKEWLRIFPEATGFHGLRGTAPSRTPIFLASVCPFAPS